MSGNQAMGGDGVGLALPTLLEETFSGWSLQLSSGGLEAPRVWRESMYAAKSGRLMMMGGGASASHAFFSHLVTAQCFFHLPPCKSQVFFSSEDLSLLQQDTQQHLGI